MLHSLSHVANSLAPWNSAVIAANAAAHVTTASVKRAIAAMPSPPRIHAAASTPQTSAKIATMATWTTHVDIASNCRLVEGFVREPCVDSLSSVHELGHAQVDDDAREGKRLAPL